MSGNTKIGIGVVVIALLAWLAFGFFGIQSAFIDNEVSEDNPFASTTSATADEVTAPDTEAPAEVRETEASTTETAVDDADPEPQEAEPTVAPEEPEIVTLASGSLVDHDHSGEGTVTVLTDGTRTFLRFEDDFAVDNGPDLNVYLVRGADANGDAGLFDDDFIDLGDLKGNIGAQNYELDPSIDVSEYNTVAIWCVRFGVAFNAANLT